MIRALESTTQNNITYKVDGNKLTIEIDMDPKFESPSGSGRSIVVASSHGFRSINGSLAVSMNVIRKK
jgi:hypothetical protein